MSSDISVIASTGYYDLIVLMLSYHFKMLLKFHILTVQSQELVAIQLGSVKNITLETCDSWLFKAAKNILDFESQILIGISSSDSATVIKYWELAAIEVTISQ